MTPKEKAKELLDYFIGVTDKEIDPGQLVPKECAKKVVEEVLYELEFDYCDYSDERYNHWEKVKDELNKL